MFYGFAGYFKKENSEKEKKISLEKLVEQNNDLKKAVKDIEIEVEDLKNRVRRKDERIRQLEEVLKIDASKFIDYDTGLLNKKFYDDFLKNKIGPQCHVITIQVRHYDENMKTLKLELAKEIKHFCERYYDDYVVWDEKTFYIFVDSGFVQNIDQIQKRLFSVFSKNEELLHHLQIAVKHHEG